VIVFCGVDPNVDLTPQAREALRRARAVYTDSAVAPIVARETPIEVQLPPGIDELLARAKTGVVVRAFSVAPLFSDEAIDEIRSAIDAPIAIEIIPADHALPLGGKRVLVTRASAQSEGMARALRRRGAIPILAPTIEIGPPEDPSELSRAIQHLERYDTVAFTSANGVDRFFSALTDAELDARALHRAFIAAIGPGTASAINKHGLRVDHVAEEHRGESLAEALIARKSKRVLLPRAAVARDALPTMLRDAGIALDVVEAYRTRTPSPQTASGVDAVTFTSSSTVERFFEVFSNANDLLATARVASIGPITSETCKRLGVRVDVEASPYTIPALVEALEKSFTSR
jgi:uroporphyrinogen III methyltransferase / synthase